MHIQLYDTPEARAAGRRYETLCVIAEGADGVLAHKGAACTVFLPWEYLARYRYQYVQRRCGSSDRPTR